MKTFRNLRVGNLLKEELSKLLLEECNFEGALVTIVEVDVDEDLKEATIKLGILPKERGAESLLRIQKVRRVLQFKLGRAMSIKPMPQIRFEVYEEKE